MIDYAIMEPTNLPQSQQHVTFVLDNRERQLATILQGLDNLSLANLDIGDFVAMYGEQTMCIVERKTIPDMAQSIKDKRYHEQKARLLSFRAKSPNTKLIYLLEGRFTFEPMFSCQSIGSKVFHSCVINSMMRDNIMFVNTKNISETAEFLQALMLRLSAEPQKYQGLPSLGFPDDASAASIDGYTELLVKPKRKDNVDQAACLLMQLSCIPGISAKKARSVIDHFKSESIAQLCHAIAAQGGKHAIQEAPGVGKVLASTIHEYLFGKST